MDIRYSANPQDVRRYTTEELRREFLITDLYQKDTVRLVKASKTGYNELMAAAQAPMCRSQRVPNTIVP